MRRLAVFFAVTILLGSASGRSEGADDDALSYRFGAGDKLRLMVLDHPELSGDMTIQRSGSISVASVGRIQAAGRDLDELEDDIAARLRESGIVEPQISLDVAEYRPIYVVGDVNTPGQYPFVMGMTVLQAIAVAGGLLTLNDETLSVRFELLQARATLDTLDLDYSTAVARRARLLAERDSLAAVRFPPDILDRQSDPTIAGMIDGETRVFETRRAALDGAIAILENQKSKLNEETSFLQAQLEAVEKRSELVDSELRDVEYLFGKGLSAKTRVLELQRLQTEVQRDRLGLLAFMSRSKQEISKVDLSIVNLRNERLEGILGDLAAVDQAIAQLEVRRRTGTEAMILHEMMSMQPVLKLAAVGDSYVITRNRSEGPEDIQATEHSYVLPGDVVRVFRFEVQPSSAAAAGPVSDLNSLGAMDPAVVVGQ